MTVEPGGSGGSGGSEAEGWDSGAGLEMLTAALRRDAADLDLYARVLTESLAEALPGDSVVLERRRSMGDRVAGRPGRVERLEVTLGERRLVLRPAGGSGRGGGRPEGEIVTVVRGVVLSRQPVELDVWVSALASAVAARAAADARAAVALEKLVLGGNA